MQSVLFGFAYAQAEDYFWQIEDTYILRSGSLLPKSTARRDSTRIC